MRTDLLATQHDSSTSIGCAAPTRDRLADPLDYDYPLIAVNLDEYEPEDEYEETALGYSHAMIDAVISGADLGDDFDAIGLDVSNVQRGLSSVNKAVGATKSSTSAVTDGIRSVTRSPITLAAIAATAAVVPVGSAVAAIAGAGLALAETGAAIADEAGKFEQWVSCIFGCGPDPATEKNAARRAKYEREERAKVERDALRVATVMVRAKAGDAKAQAQLVTIQFNENRALQSALAQAKALAKGMSINDRLVKSQLAVQATNAARRWKRVMDRAKVLIPSIKPPIVAKPRAMPDVRKVKAAVDKAAANLLRDAKAAAAKRGALSGVFVSTSGAQKRGRFINNLADGTVGWVVLNNGRAVSGRFRTGV